MLGATPGGDFQLDSLRPDFQRAREVARRLYDAFADPARGIHGQTTMPEDVLPAGVSRGSYEHRMFITLTASIDYMRNADTLWAASRRAFEDPATRYLFDPIQLAQVPFPHVVRDLQRHRVSLRPNQDAKIWTKVSFTLLHKWSGDPLELVRAADYDGRILLATVRAEAGFPFLRGRKISALYVRMLRDNVGIALKNMGQIPIPADIHVVRATMSTGVLRGRFVGSLDSLRTHVEDVWSAALQDTELSPLDVDEPLWHLSREGCSKRGLDCCLLEASCPVRDYCVQGRVEVSAKGVRIET